MVRVEIHSEVGTSRELARVLIYENEKLVSTVIAKVDLKPGADGGLYSCVTLQELNIPRVSAVLAG